ncbi:MAG: hypothetical protein IPG04_12405 [Polyangiaceae bacterium]|nr:hypothetical protein [Polyangiaceae bacterium]
MADKTLEDIEKELASLDQSYEEGYSGKDRSSVQSAGLEKLLARAQDLQGDLDKLGALTAGANAATMSESLTNRVALYERELVLVKAAQEMGPAFERFSVEGAAANFVFDRYNRHFAGQSRDTRDLGLLRELVEELKQIRKRMTAIGGKKLPEPMQKDLDLVASNIDRYQVEEREIPKAQSAGTQEEQANRWAFLANQQFAIYQAFFAGQSRVTRRPQLLVRLVDNLRRYRTAMFDLKNKGLKSASNDGNIGIVDGRLKAYEDELSEIRKTRSTVKLVDIMGVLGTAANTLFEEYRKDFAGQDRTTVSLEQLASLIDKLDEIRRQMEELGRVEKNDTNVKNATVVREYQSSWVREYAAVRQAQAGQTAAQAIKTND